MGLVFVAAASLRFLDSCLTCHDYLETIDVTRLNFSAHGHNVVQFEIYVDARGLLKVSLWRWVEVGCTVSWCDC